MPPEPGAECSALLRALADLRALAYTDRGVLEAIACGEVAVPPLRTLLFAPEPSGLFAPRCAAVAALAALRAEDVLIDFLAAPHQIADPVARVGTEAVMSCAARALMRSEDPRLPALLRHLAETRLLPGAIEWLGAHGRIEALPCLIRALGDDVAWPSAITALHSLGAVAVPALWRAAIDPSPDRDHETDTSRRRRRAALAVLRDIGADPGAAPAGALQRLADDGDPGISTAALCWQLDADPAADRRAVALRLVAALDGDDIAVRYDIESCLKRHARLAQSLLTEMDRADEVMTEATRRVLVRLAARLGIAPDITPPGKESR